MAPTVVRNWLQNDDINPAFQACANPRVLIVEDEFLIALDLEATVENMGFTVAGLASDRQHALELAPQADLAFVDVNLSDGPTGPEIGRRLAEEFGITVVFMTGNPEVIKGGIKGTLGVVTKPVMPFVVQQSLEYAVAQRDGVSSLPPQQLRVFSAN